MQMAVSSEALFKTDFRYAVCQSGAFRDFVVDTLGDSFDFNVRLGSTTIDVKQDLAVNIGKAYPNMGFDWRLDYCAGDVVVSTAVEKVLPGFPPEMMVIWVLHNPGEVILFSTQTELIAVLSTALLFAAVIWAILLSVSVTTAGKNADKAIDKISFWALLGVVVGYLMTALGIILFFWASTRFYMAASWYLHATHQTVVVIGMMALMIPLSAVGVIVAGRVFYLAMSISDRLSKSQKTGQL